jgi:uncharacterized protein (TIGR03437 family)
MKLMPIVLLSFILPCANAQFLHCGPFNTEPGGQLGIDDSGGGHLNFTYSSTISSFGSPVADADNYVLLVPSSGTTPASVTIGLNPLPATILKPGSTYSLQVSFTTVGQTPESKASCNVRYIVPDEPKPNIQAVVNSASLQPVLSPGALVSILGSHLTGPTLSTNYGPTASYPTSVASTSVTFNGVAAPLLYVSPSQINAILPFALAGQKSLQVAVQRFDQASNTLTLPFQDTSPAIFTATQSGTGQGAILQKGADGQFTYNSSANPATAGSALEIFATGAGVWTPPVRSDVFLFPANFTTQPVSVSVGGQPAKVLYAGTQGKLSIWSILQVNIVLPAGIGPGPEPVVLTIGGSDNSSQKVTAWVQ